MNDAVAEADRRLAGGDPRGALQSLVQALHGDPQNHQLWCALGRIYLAAPQPQDALTCFERALTFQHDDTASLHGAAAACEALGEPGRAVALYRQAIAQSAHQWDLHLGLASALLQAGDAESAAREAERVTGHDPDCCAAWRVRGDAAMAQKQALAATAAYRRAVALAPADVDIHYALGLACAEAGKPADAVAAFAGTLALQPQHGAALAQMCHLKRRLCDWSGLDELNARLREAVRAGQPGITPFSFLAESGDPAEQLACARLWAEQVRHDAAGLGPRLSKPLVRPAGDAPIRVGFVSSGFGNHPTALLVVELIEHLRRSDLITVGFATTPDDGGALRTRIKRAFHQFEEVDRLPLLDLAKRLRQSDLDIVFDLRGYGEGAVSPVYALRVAPVQVNWLAYPGTQGAAVIDYMMADRFVVPDAERAHYSESLLRLPHCFQPSDSTRRIPEPPSRAQCGLPETGPVLASFNNSYKIAPDVFDAWMRILRAVPDASLWLLQAGPVEMQDNLRREAAARGIDPARLVFMEKRPHPEYLACYRHVDLFLDTWPYNAHTTASDALWAGCPVLTLPGRAFAARVAGSLLHTLGLDELIADTVEDYVAKATAIASQPDAPARLRAALHGARQSAPLFDMRRFAADFAAAIERIVLHNRQGLPPSDFDF
jgi:predicted O-linked N-acetylglucosamine transferase (SPINDLY family)